MYELNWNYVWFSGWIIFQVWPWTHDSSILLMHLHMNAHIQVHWCHAQWAANAVWAEVKSITVVVLYLQRVASWKDIHTRCRVCPGLRGITARGKPERGNKHLSCANWSVKCTNCWGEGDVSAGVTALGLGAMSGPGISWVTPPPPPSQFPGPTHAKGNNGNYYLLAVCLISSYLYWLVAPPPPTCHGWGAAVAK